MNPANITRDEAERRSQVISTQAYQVAIDLTGLGVDGEPLADPAETFVSTSEIHFHSTGVPTWVNLIADEVLDAWLDEEQLDLGAFEDSRFHIAPDEGDHVLTITALCRFSHTGECLHRFVDPADGRVYCYTQFETADARRMYADFEQPDLKAQFRLTVIAPTHWTVISNALAEGTFEAATDGHTIWEFAPTQPISTYITALLAGDYHVHEATVQTTNGPIPANLLCRQSMVQYLDADRILEITQKAFDVYEEAFAYPYPFTTYQQSFVPEFNAGAMENAGCVTIRDDYLFRSRVTAASYDARDNTILHELAHMWFGDLVTMKWWDDLWLNESFAEWASTFCQDEIRKKEGGRDPWATFASSRKNWAYTEDQLPTTHPIAADMVDLEAVEHNFDGITYAKGASALKQLVAFVGQDNFLAGVREYFRKHAFGTTTLADLLEALQRASGRDLSNFRGEWLEQAGVNTLRADFDVADGRFTRFDVVQSAPENHPTLRTHRMAIGLYALRGEGEQQTLDLVQSLEIDIAGDRTPIEALVGVERPDLILLNDRDLTYAKIRLDEHSLDTLIHHVHQLSDDTARALCWSAAWDMCRDAELKQTDYIAMVVRGIGSESEPTAVNALRQQAATSALRYTPEPERHDRRVRLAADFARLLLAAAPGSDHQLAFANSVVQCADSPAAAAVLKGWLEGVEVPEGLVIDADMRWRVLSALSRMGEIGTAKIVAEAARDQTISGQEAAAGVRAALKDADTKARAWRLATDDPALPNATHKSICWSFGNYGQEDLLRPYVDRYLQIAEDISAKSGDWGTRGHAASQAVLEGLFPRQVMDRDVLAKLDHWLATTELSDSVRKVLVEERDLAERALRCQEAS